MFSIKYYFQSLFSRKSYFLLLLCFCVSITDVFAQNDVFLISDSSLLNSDNRSMQQQEKSSEKNISDSSKVITNTHSQTPNSIALPIYKPKPIRPFTQETIYGFKIGTDGWGGMYEKGKSVYENVKTSDKYYHVRFYQFELQEHKHPKEHRENYPNPYIWNAPTKPYVYGKVNNFYALKIGYGNRKMIAGKPESGTVSVHWSYAGGISLGLLKPYYLDVQIPLDTFMFGARDNKSIKYSEENKKYFLSQDVIVGHSSWAKGLEETTLIPGLQLKTALHFDFAVSKEMTSAIEVGICFEYYSKPIKIMALQDDKDYFISSYLAIQFGKRK